VQTGTTPLFRPLVFPTHRNTGKELHGACQFPKWIRGGAKTPRKKAKKRFFCRQPGDQPSPQTLTGITNMVRRDRAEGAIPAVKTGFSPAFSPLSPEW